MSKTVKNGGFGRFGTLRPTSRLRPQTEGGPTSGTRKHVFLDTSDMCVLMPTCRNSEKHVFLDPRRQNPPWFAVSASMKAEGSRNTQKPLFLHGGPSTHMYETPENTCFSLFFRCFGPKPSPRAGSRRGSKTAQKHVFFDPKTAKNTCFWLFLGGSPCKTGLKTGQKNVQKRVKNSVFRVFRGRLYVQNRLKKGCFRIVIKNTVFATMPFWLFLGGVLGPC